MRASKTDKRVNLRLVLGIGMALLGCGAVAAATRPAWKSVFTAQPAKAAPRVAVATPVPAATPAPAPKPVRKEAAAVKPLPQADAPASLAALAPAPSPVAEPQMVEGFALEGAFEAEFEPPTVEDVIAHQDQLMSAFYQSLLDGDAECCQAIVGMLNGEWSPAPSVELLRGVRVFATLDSSAVTVEGVPLEGALFESVVMGEEIDGQVEFTVDLQQGEWQGISSDVVLSVVPGQPITAGGAALGQGAMFIRLVPSVAPTTVAPAKP